MIRTGITLSALAAAVHSKLIVTNNCNDEVYIWTVPHAEGYAWNRPLQGGGAQYREPFHIGSETNPGVDVKISSEPNGILMGKPEAAVHYTVNRNEPNAEKVWFDFDADDYASRIPTVFSLHSCQGDFTNNKILPAWCPLDTNIELVLCGTDRTTEGPDTSPLEKIRQCSQLHYDAKDVSKMNPRQLRSCYGTFISPKPLEDRIKEGKGKQEKVQKAGATQVDEVKHTKVVVAKDAPASKTPADLKNILDKMQDNCRCWITAAQEIQCDEQCGKLVHTKDGKYKCLSTGDFEFCLEGKMLKRVVDPNTFAEKYAVPLLHVLYEHACPVAAQNHWDCPEFKAAIKAAYPGVDKADAQQLTSRTDPDTAVDSAAQRKKKPDYDPFKTCRELIVLFSVDMHISDCDGLLNAIRMKFGKKNRAVPLGYYIKKYDPEASKKQIKDEFTNAFPGIDWSTKTDKPTEDEAEEQKQH